MAGDVTPVMLEAAFIAVGRHEEEDDFNQESDLFIRLYRAMKGRQRFPDRGISAQQADTCLLDGARGGN